MNKKIVVLLIKFLKITRIKSAKSAKKKFEKKTNKKVKIFLNKIKRKIQKLHLYIIAK